MFWLGLLLLFMQNAVAWHTDDDLMSFVTVRSPEKLGFDTD